MANEERWRQILHQQAQANAKRWVALLESGADPAGVADEYDNILRALESTLQQDDSFDLAFRLIQGLHTVVSGFADWDRWLSYLKKALARTEQLEGKEAERARLLELAGDVYRLTGEMDAAETHLQQSADLYKGLQNGISYTRVLARLGELQDAQGNSEKGQELCRRALFLAESLEDEWLIAYVNLNLSKTHFNLQEWPSAVLAAQKAYAGFLEIGDKALALRALLNIVACQAQLGRWRKAKQAAQKVIDVAADDAHALIRLHINLGVIAYEQDFFTEAEAAWQEALRLQTQMQEPRLQATLHNNLGMVYTELEEWQEAEAMLNKAITAFKGWDDFPRWANAMDNLADLYEVRGDIDACQDVLRELLAGLEDAPPTPQVRTLKENTQQRLGTLSSQ